MRRLKDFSTVSLKIRRKALQLHLPEWTMMPMIASSRDRSRSVQPVSRRSFGRILAWALDRSATAISNCVDEH